MKKITTIILVALLMMGLSSPVGAAKAYSGIPTFSIVSVDQDNSVTIKTNNFPAGVSFTAMMGTYGSMGIGGIVVGTTNSGTGGSFTVTYSIPASLAGSNRVAIRLQSSSTGYFAYNWFYNNSSGTTNPPSNPPAGYSGFPSFSIQSVVKDESVTISAKNFPKNDSFQVLMGAYGSLGIGGVSVGTTKVEGSGSFTATYTIPNTLKGSYRIAIRLQSATSGYYAYNWFYNNSTGSSDSPPAPSGYTGFPWITINAVVRDASVTIKGNNFPPGDSFKVRLGAYGTYGVGGVIVDTIESGSGGAFTDSFSIPSSLAGASRIAIRLESPTSGYYAYNWFYNNSTP